MIDEAMLKALIFTSSPSYWQHRERWSDDPAMEGADWSACARAGDFARFVVGAMKARQTAELPRIFALVERCLEEGTEVVQTAMATCFLENLQNVLSAERAAERLVPFLGPKSRAYCRAWDRFTEVFTPGLHDEDASDGGAAYDGAS
jgi:hypothetical protein